MKSIRRAYHICTLSFRRWLGDYRILIVFLAVFTYCYMALAPVKEFLAAGNIKINACVPLFLFEFSANKFFLFLFLILLLCDAPFRDRTQQMTILRSGRISWGVGKIFYMAGSCMLYFFSVYLFSWMVLFPYIEFSNQWGKGIMTLAKTDAAARYQIVNVFFSEKIVDYFTPGQAAFFSLLLCFAAGSDSVCGKFSQRFSAPGAGSGAGAGHYGHSSFLFRSDVGTSDPVRIPGDLVQPQHHQYRGIRTNAGYYLYQPGLYGSPGGAFGGSSSVQREKTAGLDDRRGRKMETMIEVTDLVKKYQDQEVLKKISCTFEKGKIAGLIGRNGAGKTVLMKCICGFVIPTEGEIRIDGRKLRGRKEADLTKIGMIIENPAFLEAYTGYQNLAFLARINGIIGKEKIRKTLRMVGLDPDSRKKVGKYSMGMRQRLALAQAVMEDQEILILDEPMNGLDNRGVEEMRKLLLEFRGQGKTILLASHSQEDIRVLCDKIYEMDQGEIIGTQWKNQEGSE